MKEEKAEVKEQLEVPRDLEETPKQRALDYKVILLVSIFLALVLFGAIAVMSKTKTQTSKPAAQTVTPSPTPTDETANWKTYTNSQYGYSIKYPSNYRIYTSGIVQEATRSSEIGISNLKDENSVLTIHVDEKKHSSIENMNLSQIAEVNYVSNVSNHNYIKQIIAPLKLTSLDGQPAYTYTLIAAGYSGKWRGFPVGAINNFRKITTLETEKDGLYFTLVFPSDDPNLNQILSTFKFTQ